MDRVVRWAFVGVMAIAACDEGGAGAERDADGAVDAYVQDEGSADAAPDAPLSEVGVDAVPDLGPADVGADTPESDVPDAAVPDVTASDAPEAGGGDAVVGETDAVDAGPPCPTAEALEAPAVSGRFYVDRDESAESLYEQFGSTEHDEPLSGRGVALVGTGGEAATESCPDGRFSFGAVAEGTWLVVPDLAAEEACTTHNCPRRFSEAVSEGAVKIVTIGDSVPHAGPHPHFPARLRTLVQPLAEAENVNVAVPGAVTDDWLPGSDYFEDRFAPHAGDADVVVVSVGGNDLKNYMGDLTSKSSDEVFGLLEAFPEYFEGVTGNIETILEEIRARAPEADIVYCIYPNYGNSETWQDMAGSFHAVIPGLVGSTFDDLRTAVAALDGVVIADIEASLGTDDVEPYLNDPLHMNDLGHQLYADRIFEALGGVVVGEEGGPETPFTFALAP
ncbi:MAG: SGNH/GDSL hydrolase family protein [Myxococcota bacterium]